MHVCPRPPLPNASPLPTNRTPMTAPCPTRSRAVGASAPKAAMSGYASQLPEGSMSSSGNGGVPGTDWVLPGWSRPRTPAFSVGRYAGRVMQSCAAAFVLASGSAGRLRVLRDAGIDPEVMVSGVDETADDGLDTGGPGGAP